MTLKVCTYNIHKGFSSFNQRMVVHELRERLRVLEPDIVFLQEVQGQHLHHAARHHNWPSLPQHEFLAENVWQSAYGGNAIYEHGHHGNAILSRYPIMSTHNQDISLYQLERRGLLHCELTLPGIDSHVHCVCVHLSLTAYQRRRQLQLLVERVNKVIPREAPLIIAGDFNDWQGLAHKWLEDQLGMVEAFRQCAGEAARSFPCVLPLFRLDRIYTRGFHANAVEVHCGEPWDRFSDHAALTAQLTPLLL